MLIRMYVVIHLLHVCIHLRTYISSYLCTYVRTYVCTVAMVNVALID